MGSRLERIVWRERGFATVQTSPAMVAILQAVADKIAAGTGPTMVPGVDMVAGVDVGSKRSRGYVVTATNRAKYGEAKDRRLSKAIDAGR